MRHSTPESAQLPPSTGWAELTHQRHDRQILVSDQLSFLDRVNLHLYYCAYASSADGHFIFIHRCRDTFCLDSVCHFAGEDCDRREACLELQSSTYCLRRANYRCDEERRNWSSSQYKVKKKDDLSSMIGGSLPNPPFLYCIVRAEIAVQKL